MLIYIYIYKRLVWLGYSKIQTSKKMQLTVFFKSLSLSNSTTCFIKKRKTNNKERLRQGVNTK